MPANRIFELAGSMARSAGVVIHLQDLGPGPAAVGGSKNAALRSRSIGMSQRADEDDVGILRVNGDTRNAARLLQAGELPCFACIVRPVHTLPYGNMAADKRFARARPHYVRIARCHRERADRGDGLSVKDRLPVCA